MKKLTFSIVIALSAVYAETSAQVGINTPLPAASLDITAKNTTGNSPTVDGVLIPRVDRERAQSMVGVPASTLLYVNSVATGTPSGTAVNIDSMGYYYFDGFVWVKLYNPSNAPYVLGNIYTTNGTLQSNRLVTQDNKTLAFVGTAVNAFSIDGGTFSADATNHRVGIGTTAPSVKLEVQGSQFLNAAVTGAATKNALDINVGQDGFTYGNRTDNYGINMRSASSGFPGPISRINFGDTSTGTAVGTRYMSFSVGQTPNELMYLTDANAGRVGIGTTSPSVKLDVQGSQSLNAAVTTSTTKNAIDINIGQDGFSYGNRADNYGINIRSASSGFSGPVSRINFGDVSGGTAAGPRYLSFSVGRGLNELMYLTDVNSGTVGVGTTTPQKTLHVNGALQVTNELNVGGNASTAGSAGTSGQFLSSSGTGASPIWKDVPFDPSDGRVNVAKVSFPFVNVNSRDNGTYSLDGTNAPNYTIWVSIPKGSGCDVQLPDPNLQERRTINIIAAGTSNVGVCGSSMYVTEASTITSIPAGKRVMLLASNTFGGRWYVIMKDF
ncbi:hypothetical protein [Chryseobacterium sp. ERMR1:04]|uniref:hypothetical protein n=1 Tax=Chryseobacterium sp. ERMR1:04 TaxID=1705393 RepID=UPI0006C8DA12|nr:hypothetical protein [Chryseobacterium sp. ERMR1:04]